MAGAVAYAGAASAQGPVKLGSIFTTSVFVCTRHAQTIIIYEIYGYICFCYAHIVLSFMCVEE